jgi:hypothetical protein
MKFFRLTLLFSSILPLCLAVNSQIPNGSWRDHLSYAEAVDVSEVGNKIFCATTGGLFTVDKQDNTIEKYSKVNGLSDIEISAINYSEITKTLVIGYANGNIDLIRNDSIINLPDINLKIMTGSKRINNILFINNKAYLACGFGIVVINLERSEVGDTYLFGAGGGQIYVNDLAYDGKYIYAATKNGIFKADINSANLVDYHFWSLVSSVPNGSANYPSIAYFNNKLFTIYHNPVTIVDVVITFNETGWKLWENNAEKNDTIYKSLKVNNNLLIVTSSLNTRFYNAEEQEYNFVKSTGPNHGIMDTDNIFWIADKYDGLIKETPTGSRSTYIPNGPRYNDVGDMDCINGRLWVASGKQTGGKGMYSFIENQWKNYNSGNFAELYQVQNIYRIAVDPTNDRHIFGGSFGFGLVELENGTVKNTFDETNSILRNIEGYQHGYIRTLGLNFDQDGNLWIATDLVKDPVFVIHPNGEWENYHFKYNAFNAITHTGQILAVSNGQKWMLMERTGIFVFHKIQDGQLLERLITVKNQKGTLLERVYCLTEDLNGNVWVGTDKGPVEYSNLSDQDIFEASDVIGNQILIPRNDGSGLGDFLLANERINDIVVDGANQKWIATQNSGVFLMSEDGKKEIHNFTVDNSPLFSNTVVSIAINNKTGEVFFGTEKGIVSYKGQATSGNTDFKNVYVFPNPVRENYRGDITITGLIANANVKITDVSGNLVFQTTSLGGQAIWNGENFNGVRVSTGVYLVFCTNEDGSKTYVTKLLFIH